MTKFREALDKVNPFTNDGRLKTEYQKRIDAASRWDRRGRMKGSHFEAALDRASKVDRETGIPK